MDPENGVRLEDVPADAARLQPAVAAAALLVTLLSLTVLLGWELDDSRLKSVIPGLVAMNPTTAFTFLLAALSLWTLTGRQGGPKKQTGRAAGAAVAGIGLAKLCSAIMGWELGVDRILFREKLDAAGSLFRNRMAPNTAAAFVLVGLSLLLLHGGRRFRLAQSLALSAAWVGLLTLVGYGYGVRGLSQLPSYIPMALNTAIGFLVLCAGILLARPGRGLAAIVTGAGVGGALSRRLLPAAIVLPVLLGWLRAEGERRGLYPTEFGVALMVVSMIPLLVVLIAATARFLERAEEERRRAEETVRKSEARLQAILDNAPALVYLKDPAGRYIFVNRLFESVFRVKRQDIVGRTNEEAMPAMMADYRAGALRSVEGRFAELEEVVLQEDGPHTYLSNKFRIPHGAVGGEELGSISTDITARKRAEEEVQNFFDLSLDMLCIANFEGFFIRLNPAWESILGFTRAQLMEKPFIEFVHPDDRAATIAQAAKLSEGQSAVSFTNRYRCSDGSYRWLLWNAGPDVELGRIYAAARDVTQMRLSEEEIQSLNRRLQARVAELDTVNHELEAFSYSVSHDLRAPLRHVVGFADLLDRHASSTLDEKGRRFLRTISDSAKKMGRLIDDLLVFSKMGRSELQESRVALSDLVADVRRELTPDTDGREVFWDLHALPEVRGDPSMLRQVVVNLISNALKYTSTRARAEIAIGTAAGEAGETVVYVRDNGVGFDMQYEKKLFGVFQRLHRIEDFDGTGIGLANVRRIIHRHGGKTWAEGEVDRGATFYFSLPASEKGIPG